MPKLTAYDKPISAFETKKTIAKAFQGDTQGLKQQYSKLRDVAEKRRKRALQSDYAEYGWVQKHSDPFKKIKEISSEDELITELKKISDYIQNPKSTAQGLKQQIKSNISSIEKHYGEMTEAEYLLFDRYMREWHTRKDLSRYDSDRVAQFIEAQAKDKKNMEATMKNFRQYLRRYERRKQMLNEVK